MRFSVGLLAVGLLVGCARSFAGEPALPYAQIPYTSLEGDAWPVKSFAVSGLKQKYPALARDPRVTYVELNPEGERTIVFVHGLGSYLKFWRYQLDAFAAKGYRVLALDMVGYGKSDKPATFPYTTEAMADVLAAFLEHAKVRRPVVVGHSMGGQVALSLAIRRPDDVGALVLVSPAGFEEFSVRERRWFEKVFTVSLVASAAEYDLWGNIRYQNFSRWSEAYDWLIEERVRTTKDPAFEQYAYAQVKSVRGLADNGFVRTSLARVRAPTLIAFGDEDRLIPNPFLHGGTTRAVMEYGHEHIRGSKLTELDGCGHTLQIDCAAELNARMADFLASLPPVEPAAPGQPEPPAKAPVEETPPSRPEPEPEPEPLPEEARR